MLSQRSRQTISRSVGQLSSIPRDTSIRISLDNALIPSKDWQQMDARCGGDEAKIVREIAGSRYLTGEQVFTTVNGVMGTSRSIESTKHQRNMGSKSTMVQFSMGIRSFSATPKINPNNTITVSVMSASTSPADFTDSPGGYHMDQFTASLSLRNNETRILRKTQASPDAPMRINLITVVTLDVPVPLRTSMTHNPYLASLRKQYVCSTVID